MKTIAWPLDDAEIDEALRALQFRHCKWDLYTRGRQSILPDALVLSEDEHDELTRAAEDVWRALRQLEAAVLRDAEALAGVGVPAGLYRALAEERAGSPRVTRCDFHPTPEGSWLISEFNEDAPTGFAEAEGLCSVLADSFEDRAAGLRFVGDLKGAVTAALAPFERVGLVFPTGYSEDLQHVALVSEWLSEHGHRTVLGSPANLIMDGGRAAIFDQPVQALFRYFPGEAIPELDNAGDWEGASRTLPMMNSLSATVAQSKRFYAAPNEHDLALPTEARDTIAAHVPTTLYLRPSRRDQLMTERERWVLKGAFGRMGDAICMGAALTPEDWERVIDAALAEADQIAVQEWFDTAPHWFSHGLGYPTVGAFLVDGRFAGYYSRVSKNPVIDYESRYVPTLVEVS